MSAVSPQFFATTAKGLESVLASELVALGFAEVQESKGGVRFGGRTEEGMRACLWSRVASRVLLPLSEFSAKNPDELYRGVSEIDWSEHLTETQTFAVDFAASHSQIKHTHFGALKVKDAIVDQFRTKTGQRPSVELKLPDIRLNVYLNQDHAVLSLDLSGESLHERGYREGLAPAPLKENLAAALVLMAGWKEVATRQGALMDPMCGSGTLAIEAAMIACNRAPGLLRSRFGFQKWKKFGPRLEQTWTRLLAEARAQEVQDKKLLPTIVGYDRDFRAVRAAISNLERAGLRGKVHFEKRELETFAPVKTRPSEVGPSGLVVVNPPYGERLGDITELKTLYKSLGDLFKQRFKGWDAYILTGNGDLMRSVGLRPARKHVVFNGPIECRFLRYSMY